ncbi:MAG: hypothetical protein U9N61_02805 [Euryarchaeota archaeon]|nr:hypothetical protein [Euryarchaeota archaeon]
MSYSTVEAAVQTVLQKLTRFADSEITRGDYRILDAIRTDCIVLTPGSFGETQRISESVYRAWDVLADLFYCYLDDGSSWTDFATSRDAVINQLEQYPTLDNTLGITGIEVSAADDIQEVYSDDGAGPFFLMQRLRVTILERYDLTGGEFA